MFGSISISDNAVEAAALDLISVQIGAGLTVSINISIYLIILIFILFVVWAFIKHFLGEGFWWDSFEIDEAELGIGDQKVKLKPNLVDKQVAYKVWVELSTRKIGLPIDLNHDVISEIYDSWFTFFSVTRELIKEVPVSKFRRKDTERIVGLSIDILNDGIRPHLTAWQAKYRRWYEAELNSDDNKCLSPQEIQKKYPAKPRRPRGRKPSGTTWLFLWESPSQ